MNVQSLVLLPVKKQHSFKLWGIWTSGRVELCLCTVPAVLMFTPWVIRLWAHTKLAMLEGAAHSWKGQIRAWCVTSCFVLFWFCFYGWIPELQGGMAAAVWGNMTGWVKWKCWDRRPCGDRRPCWQRPAEISTRKGLPGLGHDTRREQGSLIVLESTGCCSVLLLGKAAVVSTDSLQGSVALPGKPEKCCGKSQGMC